MGGDGGVRGGGGALLHQRDSQQFTAGDGEKRDSPAGERKRKETGWREHAWNGNEDAHLANASLFPKLVSLGGGTNFIFFGE